MRGLGKLAIVVAAQVLVLFSWAGYHEHLVQTAPTFRIPLQPTDPFDLFRGRYFRLNPADAVIDRDRPAEGKDPYFDTLIQLIGDGRFFEGEVLVEFCPETETTERICHLRRPNEALPAGIAVAQEVPATVRLELFPSSNAPSWEGPTLPRPDHIYGHIDLQLDRFFLPNQIALPGPESATGWEVEVIFRPGRPLLPKRLWFKGEPLADSLPVGRHPGSALAAARREPFASRDAPFSR